MRPDLLASVNADRTCCLETSEARLQAHGRASRVWATHCIRASMIRGMASGFTIPERSFCILS